MLCMQRMFASGLLAVPTRYLFPILAKLKLYSNGLQNRSRTIQYKLHWGFTISVCMRLKINSYILHCPSPLETKCANYQNIEQLEKFSFAYPIL